MPETTLKGQCRNDQFANLLCYLQASQASGKLELRTGQRSGHVFFQAGRAVHAEYRSDLGSEAIVALRQLEEADFEFHHGVVAPTDSVFEALSTILRRAGVSIKAVQYDLELLISVQNQAGQVVLEQDAVSLLGKADGRALRTIQASLGWDTERLFEALRSLEELQLVLLEQPRLPTDVVDARIMQELRQTCLIALGPEGALMFEDGLERFGIKAESLPRGRWGEFLRSLAESTNDAHSRSRFVKAVAEMRKRLGI